jgi:hypothetical protein
MYSRKYVKELENIIMDDLLPMYIVGCRSVGIDPRANAILRKLLESKNLEKEIPWLLRQK